MSKKPKRYKPTGIIKSGYGFVFCRKSNTITVVNLHTLTRVDYTAPRTMINRFDLRLWIDGFLAGKDKGWGAML